MMGNCSQGKIENLLASGKKYNGLGVQSCKGYKRLVRNSLYEDPVGSTYNCNVKLLSVS